jgi:hypothetical protein
MVSITRRQFLGRAAVGAVATALPLDLRPPAQPSPTAALCAECALLDLGEYCCIRESLSGYESALADLNARWRRADARSVSRCAVLIVPGALEIQPSVARLVLSCAQRGATVILESGAGFAAEGGPELRAHRDALRDYLDLRIDPPVQLWLRRSGSRGLPYVDYTWPSSAKVRDFSRVMPLARQEREADGEIIARVDGLPVALKRRSGLGTFVFLGSPLGPALWAGDAEARRWLFDVLTSRRASRR